MLPEPRLPEPRFVELEADREAIEQFVGTRNRRTANAFLDAEFRQDEQRIAELLEDPDRASAITRRGAWHFTFRQSRKNPRGIWLRLPEAEEPAPGAAWEPVFDLDRFNAESGRAESGPVWHWRGAVTAWFDPMRVMLCLSLNGSDRRRYLEFDCAACRIVPGGFDLAPDHGSLDWLDADTLVCSTSLHGAATDSGWPGEIRRLERGMALGDAPVLFRAEKRELMVSASVMAGPGAGKEGGACIHVARYRAIGQGQVFRLHSDAPPECLPTPPDTEVCHNATHFAYIVKAAGGVPGTLMLGKIGDGSARVIFTPGPRRIVDPDSLCFLHDRLLWTGTDNLRPELMMISLADEGAVPVRIDLPESAGAISLGYHDARGDAGDGSLQVELSGFLQPPVLYAFRPDGDSGAADWRLLYREPGIFDASGHEVRIFEAISDDGTGVPYQLVMPKGRVDASGLPVLLYGYGGFGVSVQPGYSRLNAALWLEKGGAFALAHIRGGAEFGPDWHLAAKGAGRVRAFQDFAAIARDLVARKLSAPGRIACHGRSNGGLLCGVMLTRYPGLFGAICASVGVLDMTRFHHFPAGRAWIDEYGDPDDPAALEWLLDYSPLHSIAPAEEVSYPPCLIDTSAHDDRVDPSHSRRMVAALEAHGHRPWFFEHGDGGHGGGGATGARAREAALFYRFLKSALGISASGGGG